MAQVIREEKEYFNQVVSANNGNKEERIVNIGALIGENFGKDEIKLRDTGETFRIFNDIEGHKNYGKEFDVNINGFFAFHVYPKEAKNIYAEEDSEKPVNNSTNIPSGLKEKIKDSRFNIDDVISYFFYAGIVAYAYKIYSSDEGIKNYIKKKDQTYAEGFPETKNYYSSILQNNFRPVAEAFGDGRAEYGSEADYIINVCKVYKANRSVINENFSTESNAAYRCKRKDIEDIIEESYLSVYFNKNHFKNAQKDKKVEYGSLQTRSCQLMFMAIQASKYFYEVVQGRERDKANLLPLVAKRFNNTYECPSVPIKVVYHKKSIVKLSEALEDPSYNAELPVVDQGMSQTSYHPFNRALFDALASKKNAVTSDISRGGTLENIIIHYTGGGGRYAEGNREYSNKTTKQAAANFYVSTNVSTDNNAEKTYKKADIVMSIPHECWAGSVDNKPSKTGFDAPYSNGSENGAEDINKINVRTGLIKLTSFDEQAHWRRFTSFLQKGKNVDSSKGEKNTPRYETNFNNMYNIEKFHEQAKKEAANLKARYKDLEKKLINSKSGKIAAEHIHDSDADSNFPRRLSTNKTSIAIETSYGLNDLNDTGPATDAYTMLYGGMNLVKQDCLKNLKYLVRFLLDHYAKDSTCLMRHFDHGGKSCPYGFIGDMAWDYLKMYIGGLSDKDNEKEGNQPKETLVNVRASEFNKFISKYIGGSFSDNYAAGEAFAKRWNGIKGQKKMEWTKETDVLTNGTITRIVSKTEDGVINSSTGDKVGDIETVVFETIYYTEREKTYQNQVTIPANSFYKERATLKFYNNCEIPKTIEEDIIVTERGEELPDEGSETQYEEGEQEEKKVSINEVRNFINKWICVDGAGVDGNKNASLANSAAENKSGNGQTLFDVQNYYDFCSGMTPMIEAKFRGIESMGGSSGNEIANWIGINSIDHPYFKSLNIKDNGVKTATLVLYDKDFASYQRGIVSFESGKDNKEHFETNITTIYSLEQIIKQAIGTCVIAKKSEENKNIIATKDDEGATVSDSFLTFSKSKEYGPTNLKLRWGYADYNEKTAYRGENGSKSEVTESQQRLTNWEKKLYQYGSGGPARAERWWDVKWQVDTTTFQVKPSRYIENGSIATQDPNGKKAVTLKNGSDKVDGDEGINDSRDRQINGQNSTSVMTPWIDFMIIGLKSSLTNKGIEYTITAIESKDGEVIKDRFLQKYVQISTYPEEVLYLLMSIFNEDPITGEPRKNSPVKILLYKEATDPRAFVNNELDFSNMPEQMKDKYREFNDTYSLDNAGQSIPDMEKYLKKITLSFGSADAQKTNYSYSDKPRLYKSVASLFNEFTSACPPRKEKQYQETITTEDGMEVKSDNISEASRPLKWFTCKRNGTTYIVLYYRRALRPRIIRNYIWGPHNPYQSCVKKVEIENQNEFAVLAGIQAFNEKGEKETKLKLNNGSHGAFGQGQVDVRRFQKTDKKEPSEDTMDKGETADFIFTDIKSRNNYQEAYSNSVYSGNIELLGDPFYVFDGLMQPCTYPIKLDVLIPFNDFHAMRGGAKYGSQFDNFDQSYNTYYDDNVYGNQRRHETSGYYVIKEIEHNISPGVFTTRLGVISYPQIEYQILDQKGGKPIEPVYKNVERGRASETQPKQVTKKKVTQEEIYYQSNQS